MVFLDYASTYPVVKYPQQLYRDVLGKGYFFNPNANYAYKEKRLLAEAEDRVKKAVGAGGGKVVFGGTSSQLIENLFTHIAEETNEYITLSGSYEHDAMWRFIDDARKDICSLEHAIRTYHGDKQLIVSLMGVNNLTGEIFPVEEIGKLCHEHDAFYICDMTAMIGHVPIPANIDQWCDCVVWSGHKLGTELGIGAMWISDRLDEWLNGFKLRGTPNLAGALAMTQAVEDACDKEYVMSVNKQWYTLMSDLYYLLKQDNPDVERIGDKIASTYAINAIHLPGFNANALQQYLTSKQIYVSIGGSACADNDDYRVLAAFGLTKEEASQTVRISFGESTSQEDIDALVRGIVEFKNLFI